MNTIDILRCFVQGMFFCLDLSLSLLLCLSYQRHKHDGRVVPSLCMASMAFGLEAISVLFSFLHGYFPDVLAGFVAFTYLKYFFVLSDLITTSLFIMSVVSLFTSHYPSLKSILLVGLSALCVWGAYVITESGILLSLMSAIWLFVMSLIMLRRVRSYNKSLTFYYSNVHKHRIFWVVIIMFVMFWLYPFYWIISLNSNFYDLFVVYALIQMSVHLIFAYNLTSQITTSFMPEVIVPSSEGDATGAKEDELSSEDCQAADTFFTPAQQRKMAEHLNKLMTTDKLYRNPDLCVGDLVCRVGTNTFYFYYFMRDVMRSNFFDYVNGFRINEAKEMLMKGEKVDYIVSVVGYNSANTFRRAFKKATGVTPSEWRNSQ